MVLILHNRVRLKMDGWMDGWMDGRTAGWMDRQSENFIDVSELYSLAKTPK